MRPPDVTLRTLLAAAITALATGCATVPLVQQGFAVGLTGPGGGVPLPCTGAAATVDAAGPRVAVGDTLPADALRVMSWNLHKNDDAGWQDDLSRFAARSDLLLIQEAALTDPLQRLLADAGYDGLLASAFVLDSHPTGVLTAARVPAVAACIQRRVEPLLQLPKSALIARYRLAGSSLTLAVANLHAINFTLGLDDYRAQLDAVAGELAGHAGPVIVGGDFNTWSAERLGAVDAVMNRLGLVAVAPADDQRSRFFGRQLDHLFVRGLELVHAEVPQVGSSDHNPLLATLRLLRAAP